MPTPGSTYVSSNQFERLSLWHVLLTMVVCLLCGYLFERLVFLLALEEIWLFVAKCVLAFFCLGISHLLVGSIQSRNQRVNYLIVVSVSLLTWYGLWASVLSQFEESHFFWALLRPWKVVYVYAQVQQYLSTPIFTDALAFSISIMAFASKQLGPSRYYCEPCHTYYETGIVYADFFSAFLEEFRASAPGQYDFMRRYSLIKNPDIYDKRVSLGEPFRYMGIEVIYCPNCKKNTMVTLYECEKEKYKKDDEEHVKTMEELNILIQAVYVNRATEQILLDVSGAFSKPGESDKNKPQS